MIGDREWVGVEFKDDSGFQFRKMHGWRSRSWEWDTKCLDGKTAGGRW